MKSRKRSHLPSTTVMTWTKSDVDRTTRRLRGQVEVADDDDLVVFADELFGIELVNIDGGKDDLEEASRFGLAIIKAGIGDDRRSIEFDANVVVQQRDDGVHVVPAKRGEDRLGNLEGCGHVDTLRFGSGAARPASSR
jgi:hypothetical protein